MPVGLRDVWTVVRTSAEKRLGKPLLRTYLLLALFGVAIVAACIVVPWSLPVSSNCSDEPVVRVYSPNGHHELIVACVDCGATTTWVYQVRIARRHAWFSRQQLVIAAETPGGCNAEEVRAAWLDETHVRVDFDGYIRRGHPVHARVDGVDVDVETHTQDP